MSDWAVGFAIGIATGLAIGITVTRKEKTWSELSDREKRWRIGLIATGVALFIAGLAVFFVVD
jgi:hypothetical protein